MTQRIEKSDSRLIIEDLKFQDIFVAQIDDQEDAILLKFKLVDSPPRVLMTLSDESLDELIKFLSEKQLNFRHAKCP